MNKSRTYARFVHMTFLSVIWVFALTGIQGFANEAKPWSERVREITSVEGVTEYALDNGLKILLFPEPSKNQIFVNVTYYVGSRHEAYGETGMAHLLEHLVFKGTPKYPNIDDELSKHGASANGTTWLDRTNYYESFVATDENLEWALDMEADRMVNSFIAKEDLDSEMTVVRNEWESGENNPRRVLDKRVSSAAYSWHNYGNSTIGARSDIENVPIERLQGFYRKYYQPDNAVLIVTGRIETDKTLEMIVDTFGRIPRPERVGAMKIFPTYTREPAQDGERTVVLERVGEVQYFQMVHHIPSARSEDAAKLTILSNILSTSPSGRLYKNVVETGLATSARAYPYMFNEGGLFDIGAEIRKEDSLEEAEAAIHATIQELIDNPPSEEEVDRAKTEIQAQVDLALSNPTSMGAQFTEYEAMGDWRLFFLTRDRYAQVTPEDVQAVAAKYLVKSNRTSGYFRPVAETPERVSIPEPVDLDELFADYTGGEAQSQGEVFDPTPVNIEKRVQRSKLSNGIQVALLPKQNRGATVNISLSFRHATPESRRGNIQIGRATGAMLMRGTENRTREEINDTLDQLKAQGGIGGNVAGSNGSFTTVSEHLPAVIELAAEIFQKPAFPTSEFEVWQEQSLASIETSKTEPSPLASIKLRSHIQPYPEGHPLHVTTLEEQFEEIEAITIDAMQAFYDSNFGATGGTIAVVGTFDPDEILQVLEEQFGSWDASKDYERVPSEHFVVDALDTVIETPDKTNAVLVTALTLPIDDAHPDAPALRIGAHLLGGGFLNSRLATRIRQKEGLSYGVGANIGLSSLDKVATLQGSAIFAPENGQRVLTAFREEIAKVIADGYTDEETKDGIDGYLGSRLNSRSSDGNLASSLQNLMFVGRTMEWIGKDEEKIAKLTTEQINEAFRKHVSVEDFSFVLAGDFAKAASDVADTGE